MNLWRVWRLIARVRPGVLALGALLQVVTLAAGAGLLGLSGWFIAAAGVAGLGGVGLVFNVFGPAAGVRGLAITRTAGRYGERLLTHEATLRALAALRVDLLKRQAAAGLDGMLKLRGATALNRMTSDVDALDGVALRLMLPLIGAVAVLAPAFVLLWQAVALEVALAVVGIFVLAGGAVLLVTARAGHVPSVKAERAGQALRREAIDLVRARVELIVHGRMADQRARVAAEDEAARAAALALDRVDRGAGLALSLVGAAAMAAAIAIGGGLVAAEKVSAPAAVLAIFVALALAEITPALRRGMAELGRMQDAAGRVMEGAGAGPAGDARGVMPVGGGLEVSGLRYRRVGAERAIFDGLSLHVAPREVVVVAGPSGTGKSTLLWTLAGLLPAEAGVVRVSGATLGELTEVELRARLAMLPQRTALVAGTVRENLALARDWITDDEAWVALEAAGLDEVVRGKGGLDATLGEAGAGLSGGEQRRLALARVLVRRPMILLLDEPTEGLDAATAERVLKGIRAFLPEAATLAASHRRVELDWADRVVRLV